MYEPETKSASYRESQIRGWTAEVYRPPDLDPPGVRSASPPPSGNTPHFPPGYTTVNQIHQNDIQWAPRYLRQSLWKQSTESPVEPPRVLKQVARRNPMHPSDKRVTAVYTRLNQFLHTTTGNRSRRSLNRLAGMRDSTTTSGYWRARFFADANGSLRPWPKRRRTILTQLIPDNRACSKTGPPGLRRKQNHMQ